MLNIHCSRDLFKFPSKYKVVHHPYNGTPFSEHYTVSYKRKSMTVSFGTGGFYPSNALRMMKAYLYQIGK